MKIKRQLIKDLIYNKIVEYRPILITTVIIMIPIIYLLYILNLHHYIFPTFLGDSVIFQLDMYYRYFAFIFLFMYIYELYYKKEKTTVSNIFLYIFIIMTILSTIFAYNKETALFGYPNRYEGMYTILFYCFMYLNCQKINDEYYVKKMTKVIISVSFIHLLLAILQLTGIFEKIIYMYNGSHIIGLTSNSNFLGSLMCMLSILTSTAYLLKIDKKNWYYFITFIVCYITLLLANSTGPFISFIITLIIFIIYLFISKKVLIKRLITIIIITVLLYPIILYPKDKITPEIKNHVNYLVHQLKGQKENNNVLKTEQLGHGRIKIWKNTIKAIKKRPLIGYGPDNLGIVYEKQANETKIADKAHNIYLHITVSSGIFATIGYLGFVIINIVNAIKSKNNLITVLAFSIIAYSIQGIFNINVIEVTPYFYLILGFMMTLIKTKCNN